MKKYVSGATPSKYAVSARPCHSSYLLSSADLNVIKLLLQKLPSVKTMSQYDFFPFSFFPSFHLSLFPCFHLSLFPSFLLALIHQRSLNLCRWPTTQELRTNLDKIDRMLYPLLRWLLTSARAHLAKLKVGEVTHSLPCTYFLTVRLSLPPAQSISIFSCLPRQPRRGNSRKRRRSTAHSGLFMDRTALLTCLVDWLM